MAHVDRNHLVVRRAAYTDVSAIVDLAVAAVSADPLPVRVDKHAMADKARQMICGNQHFIRVAAVDGEVVACVAAEVGPGWWHERMAAAVLMFYTRRPGAGVPLLREFRRWLAERPGIKYASFFLEPNADPRIGVLLDRLGFNRKSATHTWVRGQ